MKTDKEVIYEFLVSHSIGVLSTVTADYLPESAAMGISVRPNLEVIFGTFVRSRKYNNLQTNPRVSLVIGWDKGRTVQYEGEAQALQGRELDEYMKTHLAKVPTAAKHVSDPERVFFKVTPRWIRYSDSSRDPWDVIELSFTGS